MVSKIKRLWHNEQGVQGAAALLVVTMLLSNILGFLRDLILANSLPLSILDTYYAAFRLPDFLFNLFILGAISSAFIPVYLDIKTNQGDDAAWKLTHNLINSALIILAVLGSVLFIFMPQILPHFLPGFPPEKIANTVPLARVLLLSPFFFAVSYVFGGVLNAHKKFFAYAIAPLVYNSSIIVGGFLVPYFGVNGVAWAVVIGAALHALVQLPALRSAGYRPTFIFDPMDKSIKRVISLMVPRSVSLGMMQLVLLFFTRIGSFLPSGTVSIFSLTNNVQTTPVAIFAASIGTAVFPMLGAATSDKDDRRYNALLTESLRGMLFFIIPSMVLLWILRAHIIRLYLALNHQTWTDTIRAIDTFSWFILALASQGFNLIMIRAYYARQDTKRPMIISIIGGAVAITLAWFLAGKIHDVPALSLAFALGTITESIILLAVFMAKYPKLLTISSVVETIGIAGAFAIISGLLARLTLSVVSEGTLTNTAGLGTAKIIPLFIALVAAGIVGVTVYLSLSFLFNRNELLWFWPKRAARAISLPDSEEIAGDEGLA
jgi:putative peptidoglycan lipid II flippase